jgi:hypothetical protein
LRKESRNPLHFIEAEGSLPYSQELSGVRFLVRHVLQVC